MVGKYNAIKDFREPEPMGHQTLVVLTGGHDRINDITSIANGGLIMKLKRYMILVLLVLPLFAVVILFSWGGNKSPERAIGYLLRQIERGNVNDINLQIYYYSLDKLIPFPMRIDALVGGEYDYKVEVSGSCLEEHIELLNRMGEVDLKPMDKGFYPCVRLYYIFETANGRKIFDVAMFGFDERILINGSEFVGNDAFYDIVIPFLPEDAVIALERTRRTE